MENKLDLNQLLTYVDPANLSYNEWLTVGMALQYENYDVSSWESWSRRDFHRYHDGECLAKWKTFGQSGINGITGATITQMAKDNGWLPEMLSHELEWNDTIGADEKVIVHSGWVESLEVLEPKDWNPVQDLIRYLELLFDSTDNVGYVTQTWEREGRYLPTKGSFDRTAGELIQLLQNCKGDITNVFGDYNEQAGAWIRFNPLDGEGVKNDNVTDFRYALVESDVIDIEKQNAIIRQLELPVAVLVHSGKKSLHAIVKIDAGSYEEYRKRVDYLYGVCQKNGLKVDTQNKNPSRLSRMPGIVRNGQKQFLVDTEIGKACWSEWQEWIEAETDNLPNPESLADYWDDLPDLAEPLINGILRKGHKMLLAGPSKAGKSFALIELVIAIAEGKKWLDFQCETARVLYVNLELDSASCLHRFRDVYVALGWRPDNIKNIDIWNLRGKSVPMDKLAPKLIRRARKQNYGAIVIDPIYKVITGDENSADQMAAFCNEFDKLCTELGSAVIYCHHHSKGSQGNKRSMDRASGSGVFARDPDALLDLIELDLTEDLSKQEENKAVCAVCEMWLKKYIPNYQNEVSQDDLCSENALLGQCQTLLGMKLYSELLKDVHEARNKAQAKSAWRIEGTLREFPKFKPANVWFDYPIHKIDLVGSLKDIDIDGGYNYRNSNWKKNFGNKKTTEEREAEQKQSLETAFSACNMDDKSEVSIAELSEYLGVTDKTVRNKIKKHGGFWIDGGTVGLK